MDSIQIFLFQMAIVTLVVNSLVNVFKPFWQDNPNQDKIDLGVGFALSILLCVALRVDGFTLLLGFAFPDAVAVVPWWVGSIITGLLGEKLASLLNDLPKSNEPVI